MTIQERLTKVYNLITAAQWLLEQGRSTLAMGLIQTARIIASKSDEFLQLNKVQVDKDCATALEIIEKASEG